MLVTADTSCQRMCVTESDIEMEEAEETVRVDKAVVQTRKELVRYKNRLGLGCAKHRLNLASILRLRLFQQLKILLAVHIMVGNGSEQNKIIFKF